MSVELSREAGSGSSTVALVEPWGSSQGLQADGQYSMIDPISVCAVNIYGLVARCSPAMYCFRSSFLDP